MKTRSFRLKRLLLGAIAAGFVAVMAGWAWAGAANEPLKLIKSVPLPMLKDGDFDHFTADLASNRLFSAAEENSKVLVFNLKTGELLKVLTDLKAPHSLVYRDDLKRLYVVDGDLGKIRMYDGTTYQNAGDIEVREGADSMAYDPATKYMFVVNGGADAKMPNAYLTTVDTTADKKIDDIKLDSDDVEAVVLDSSSQRIFVEIRGNNAIEVFNRETLAKLATWPLPQGAAKPSAMALDAADHRLLIGTRVPCNLVLMDSDTGKVVSVEPAASMVDDLAFDMGSKQAYFAGTEFLDVFQKQSANK
ncbi:MAG: YncE family protein, partial [Candidatus Acidiferrales bacterium]